MADQTTPKSPPEPTWDGNLIGVWWAAGVICAVLLFCTIALFWPSLQQIALALLASALAAILGWAMGTFISPYSDEAETFSNMWTVLSGVASGVVLTKIYDFASEVVSGKYPISANMKYRIALGLGWLALFALHTFLTRHYSARLAGRK